MNEKIKQRYLNDRIFHNLVETFRKMIFFGEFSLQDLKDAIEAVEMLKQQAD